ncbi:hypothetical protein [Streptomyces pactum]|uniref:Lipoprotein n=1 Tax=Streptomyces pactum TaxID=68249 RepID=A0A1S6J894_9ACTN|nr:hypothetical protein [Streptomyces pactum]AQS67960.1 hypothetical protein B1H29_14390 [Streptomyces pactum]
MRALLWPAAAAALLAVGCSSAPDRDAAAEKHPDPRPLGGALHYTAAESAALHRAEEREVRKCMAGRGFDYHPIPVGDVRRRAAESPYGLLTRSRAAQDGYGLTVRRLKKPPADPNAQRVSALAEGDRRAWEAALKGAADGPREEIELPGGPTVSVATDSCVSVARRALYGASWDRNHYALQSLRNMVVTDTLDHALMRAAERKWAACMRDEGFRYEHREDPLKALKKRLDSAGTDAAALRATGREELRIAVRDAACQVEADLAEQVVRAQKRVEKALPAARTSLLDDFRAARRTALEHAEARDTAGQVAASPSA